MDEPFDYVCWIWKYETANLSGREEIVEGFQHIINSGLVNPGNALCLRRRESLRDENKKAV